MLVGFIWYSFLKMKSPQILAGIEHDLEVAVMPAMK
jgi:hypothetical protein